jgi:hypothetical protein
VLAVLIIENGQVKVNKGVIMKYTKEDIKKYAVQYIESDDLTREWIESLNFDDDSLRVFKWEAENIRGQKCYDYLTDVYQPEGKLIEIAFSIRQEVWMEIDNYKQLSKDLRKFFRNHHKKDHPVLSNLLNKDCLKKLI